MNLSRLVDPKYYQELSWLGRIGKWFTTERRLIDVDGVQRAGASFVLDTVKLRQLAKTPNEKALVEYLLNKSTAPLSKLYVEAAATLIASGPKLFMPTDEQFESMENVRIDLPPYDFRTPFPVLVVGVPINCRRRLSEKYGIPMATVTSQILVRHREIEGDNSFVFVSVPFGPNDESSFSQFGTEQWDDETIEEILSLQAEMPTAPEPKAEADLSHILTRAALNLSLWLTLVNCQVGGPVMPHEYAKHRAKKHLQWLKHGDYLAIDIKQNITIRERKSTGQQGEGTGVELSPGWRRGHMRAVRGYGQRRRAGEIVPLEFVHPCLVRPDRIVGDLGDSEVTYNG